MSATSGEKSVPASGERKKSPRAPRAALACAVVFAVAAAGFFALIGNASFQRAQVERALAKRGVEAHFEALRFGVFFSDEISVRGASLKFPGGRRARLDSFSARHNGVCGLFSGTPAFRDFSCVGFALEEADGSPLFGFSFGADEIGASFLPAETLGRYVHGNAFPFALRAKNFRVKSASGREIARGDASARFSGAEPMEFSGKIRGNFAALLAQPAFAKINNVAAGTFELTGQGRTARLALRDLRSRVGNIDVPALTFSAARGEGMTGTLAAELFVSEKSSAEIRFSHLSFSDGQLDFIGKTTAETLVVADIFRAGLLFRGWRAPAAEAPAKSGVPAEKSVAAAESGRKSASSASAAGGKSASSSARPARTARTATASGESPQSVPAAKTVFAARERAFWSGVRGKMDFRAKRVIFPSNETGVHEGAFSVSDDCVQVDYAVPEFFRGSAGGSIALRFEDAAPHYSLSGRLRGSDVEIRNAVPALRGRDPVPIEGRFNLNTEFSARADRPEQLERALAVRVEMESSTPGRVRIFNAKSRKMRLAGDVLRVGGDLAKMLGGLTRNLEPRASRLAESVGLIKNCLTDFPYSKMKAVGEYRAGGDVACRELEISGESLRFGGNGSVRPLAGEPPELWPMKFSFSAAARGEAADALRELGLLRSAGTLDADGFVPAREFEFSGCAADFSDKFFETLMDAAAGKDVRNPRPAGAPAETILDALMR